MMNCEWLTCLALNLLLWGDPRYALSKAARYGWPENLYTWDTVHFKWLQGEGCLDVQLSQHCLINTELI